MNKVLLSISNAVEKFDSRVLSPADLLELTFYIATGGVALGLIIATFIWL